MKQYRELTQLTLRTKNLLRASSTSLCLALAPFTFASPPKQLPDGPGKEALQRVCSSCHGAEIVMGKHLTKDGWTQVVEEMIQRGAEGSEDDFTQIVDYLAANFPPRSEVAKTSATDKVNVNKASADELRTSLGLAADQASSIVDYRQKNGDFKSIDDLKKVPGLDVAKVDSVKDRINFGNQ